MQHNSNVASLLGLPRIIRKDDGSLQQLEQLFQAVNKDMSRTIDANEFVNFFSNQSIAAVSSSLLPSAPPAGGMTLGGSEKSHDSSYGSLASGSSA